MENKLYYTALHLYCNTMLYSVYNVYSIYILTSVQDCDTVDWQYF